MNSKALHICLVGLHPVKSCDNIINLVYRILKYNKLDMDVKINIIHDTGDKESYLLKNVLNTQPTTIKNYINWIEYESEYLSSGNSFQSRNLASLIVQNEPIKKYVSLETVQDDDFILRCRSDYFLTDEFLKMILDNKFYKKLDNSDCASSIFNKKIWTPYIGTQIFLDCCDYFYVINVKDQKDCLITDQSEAEKLWFDSFLSSDKRYFAERVFFVKPLLKFLKDNQINTTSKKYWKLINDNFVFGGDLGKIKTCFYGWRHSAWQGIDRLGIKVSGQIMDEEVVTFGQNIEKYSKIKPLLKNIKISRIDDSHQC